MFWSMLCKLRHDSSVVSNQIFKSKIMAKQIKKEEEPANADNKWSSVERQLEKDNVTRGSELEKLIKANQELHLVRPEEHENDNVELPLWIRVHWRKNHPEQEKSATPLGDYPDALYNIYSWMLAHHDLAKEKKEETNLTNKQKPPQYE